MNEDFELWQPIDGFYKLYEISSHGRVRSLERKFIGKTKNGNDCERRVKSRILKPGLVGKGYLSVSLSRDGVVSQYYVHHLVAEAFIGDRPEGFDVAHNDGVKANCRYGNLRYATQSENESDKQLHGTVAMGSRNGQAILNEDQVKQIKQMVSCGATYRVVAALFSVSRGCIADIICGRNWSHVS